MMMPNKIYAEMLKEQLIVRGFTRVRISVAGRVPTVSGYTPDGKLIRAMVPGLPATWRLQYLGWFPVQCLEEPTR